MGAALDLIESVGIPDIELHCYALGDRLIAGLDNLNIPLVGPRNHNDRSPHIYVPRLPAEHWYSYLAQQNIRVSPERDGIRISLGMFNTEKDIGNFLDAVSNGLTKLDTNIVA